MLAKLITFVVVMIFFITGLLTMITISTNAKPFSYIIYNELDYVTEYSHTNYMVIPTVFTNTCNNKGYNKDVAGYCIDLITRLEANQTVVPSLRKQVEFESKMNKGSVFSVVWYSDNTIWVAFRGSSNLQEWINNFKIQQMSNDTCKSTFGVVPSFMEDNSDIMIHAGFLTMYNELREGLLESIKGHPKGEDVNICVTGYSLGGAIANIFALDLKTMGYDVDIYSFGSPRIGNKAFSDAVRRSKLEHYRIVNTEDTITQMPLPISPNFSKHDEPFFYTHNGEEYKFTQHNKSIYTNHSHITYANNINNVEM
jgi:triacylglycerol lipase